MKKYIKNFENFKNKEEYEYLLDDVADYINTIICDYNEYEVCPIVLYTFGSRIKGNFKNNSDIDVLFLYKGSLDSKRLQDPLNERVNEEIDYEFTIDITPVNETEITFLKKFYSDYDIQSLPKYIYFT